MGNVSLTMVRALWTAVLCLAPCVSGAENQPRIPLSEAEQTKLIAVAKDLESAMSDLDTAKARSLLSLESAESRRMVRSWAEMKRRLKQYGKSVTEYWATIQVDTTYKIGDEWFLEGHLRTGLGDDKGEDAFVVMAFREEKGRLLLTQTSFPDEELRDRRAEEVARLARLLIKAARTDDQKAMAALFRPRTETQSAASSGHQANLARACPEWLRAAVKEKRHQLVLGSYAPRGTGAVASFQIRDESRGVIGQHDLYLAWWEKQGEGAVTYEYYLSPTVPRARVP